MKVVICGAGIAGLALAHRLAALHWEVTVVEKAPGPRTQGYMIDFFGPGYEAAEAIGLLPRLAELGYEVDEMCYLDTSGRRRSGLDYAQFGQALDGRLLSIMRPDLEMALREAVQDDVDLRFGSGISRIDNSSDGVRVTLSDGGEIGADLLVGADGIHSSVRSTVFGPEPQFLRYLGFHTAAFLFEAPHIHQQIGNRFCLTDTTGRQMGFYGLRDGRVAAFTVHRTDDPAMPTDLRQALHDQYGSLGWIVPEALERCPPTSEIYYDQVAQIEMPHWSRQRVTLLGDACQAVSLLAGQGASLAVAGAYVLAGHLADADPNESGSVDAALSRYQRSWQPVVSGKQQVARRGAEWFLPSSALRLHLRRSALRLTGLPGMARFFGTALVGKSTATIEELSGRRDLHQLS